MKGERKIYKYELDLDKMALEGTDRQTIPMPLTALLEHIGVQNGKICLWAEVNTEYMKGNRTFCVIGTGYIIPDDVKSYDYKATIQMPPFVWHIYEVK